MKTDSFSNLSTMELLKIHTNLMNVLRDRKILRTMNNPVAGYGEYLTCEALFLTPAPNSEKGFDAWDADKKKYEIKARRITRGSDPTRYSAIRQIDEHHFDFLIAIIFESDFRVKKAIKISYEVVRKNVKYQEHTHSWMLPARISNNPDFLSEDLTPLFIKSQIKDL